MNNSKQDSVGYCIRVQEDKVNVLKIRKKALKAPSFPLIWIKKLISENTDTPKVDKSVFIEVVTGQFSDLTIDVFVDENGIDKGLPPIAVTNSGVFLIGNVVVLASDREGNSILLSEKQVQTALNELGFYKQYKGVEIVDVDSDEREFLTNDEHPEVLKNLLGLLIEYCIDREVQVLSKAQTINGSTGDTALVMCLHGDPKFIDSCHQLLGDFIAKQPKSAEEV